MCGTLPRSCSTTIEELTRCMCCAGCSLRARHHDGGRRGDRLGIGHHAPDGSQWGCAHPRLHRPCRQPQRHHRRGPPPQPCRPQLPRHWPLLPKHLHPPASPGQGGQLGASASAWQPRRQHRRRPPPESSPQKLDQRRGGRRTINGSLQLEGYLPLGVSSGLVGLTPSAQKLLQRLRPGGALHRTGWPVPWALGAGLILSSPRRLPGLPGPRTTPRTWRSPRPRRQASAQPCAGPWGPLWTWRWSASGGGGCACRWPLVTVLLLSFATWGALGRTGGPAAFPRQALGVRGVARQRGVRPGAAHQGGEQAAALRPVRRRFAYRRPQDAHEPRESAQARGPPHLQLLAQAHRQHGGGAHRADGAHHGAAIDHARRVEGRTAPAGPRR